MNKIQLIILIKMYTKILKDIESALMDYQNANLTETKPYQDLYAYGNDVSQKLDDLKYELKHA